MCVCVCTMVLGMSVCMSCVSVSRGCLVCIFMLNFVPEYSLYVLYNMCLRVSMCVCIYCMWAFTVCV